jgi:hypothetical protein
MILSKSFEIGELKKTNALHRGKKIMGGVNGQIRLLYDQITQQTRTRKRTLIFLHVLPV